MSGIDPFETIDPFKAGPAFSVALEAASQSGTNVQNQQEPARNVASTLPLRPHDLNHAKRSLRERYDRIAELGRGGWGVVDRVVDTHLEREVAVKRIGGSEKLGASKLHAEIRQRFLHEAKITSQLQHPGVVPVHEYGTNDNGESYYAMKLLQGDTLRQLIRKQHSPARQAAHRWTRHSLLAAIGPLLDRFIHVCQAVGYAHQHGVIHRDLKPANVMAGGFGETIVVDWGLAKRYQLANRRVEQSDAPDEVRSDANVEQQVDVALAGLEVINDQNSGRVGDSDRTVQGSIIGTPAYMSPEQASGLVDRLGPTSDVYSLGVMLYEIIAGRHPYHELPLTNILEQVKEGKRLPITQSQPCTPKALAAICHKAMALNPRDRYQSASLMADDIRRFIAGDSVSVYAEPLLDRIGRLCRRYQSTCVVAGICTALLLVSTTIFSAVVHRAHAAEQAARTIAESSHRDAVASLSEARNSADSWLAELSGAFEFYPGLQSVRADLIISAKQHYESILKELDKDVKEWTAEGLSLLGDDQNVLLARIEQSQCHARLGDLDRLMNHQEAASSRYRNAEEILNSLCVKSNLKDDVNESSDEIRLQQINVLIGKQFLANADDSLAKDAIERLENQKHFLTSRRWLLEKIKCSNIDDETRTPYVLALVRYAIARSGTDAAPDLDAGLGDALEEAVTWSRWLLEVRPEMQSRYMNECVQRQRAKWLNHNNELHASAKAWATLVEDLKCQSQDKMPRPDRLHALANARIKHADVLASLGDLDQAIAQCNSAIDELNQSWRLLDTDTLHDKSLAIVKQKLSALLATRHSNQVEESVQQPSASTQKTKSSTYDFDSPEN